MAKRTKAKSVRADSEPKAMTKAELIRKVKEKSLVQANFIANSVEMKRLPDDAEITLEVLERWIEESRERRFNQRGRSFGPPTELRKKDFELIEAILRNG